MNASSRPSSFSTTWLVANAAAAIGSGVALSYRYTSHVHAIAILLGLSVGWTIIILRLRPPATTLNRDSGSAPSRVQCTVMRIKRMCFAAWLLVIAVLLAKLLYLGSDYVGCALAAALFSLFAFNLIWLANTFAVDDKLSRAQIFVMFLSLHMFLYAAGYC
jgi:hypothetical protein